MAGLLDEMRPTPRNRQLGLLADLLTKANDYAQRPDPTMPMGKANPVLGLLADAMSLKSLATTADRASYGEALTNAKKANVPFLKPETADALMMAPVSPRTALAAASMGLGSVDNGVMKAATVWHGSPHKFDKFAIAENMGRGEGAQAYGHGLYLAEAQDVAKTYKDINPTALQSPIRAFKGAELNAGTPEYHAATLLDNMGLQQARKTVAGWIATADPRMAREVEGWKKTLETLNAATSKADFKTLKNTGNLYKVDLPDDQIAKMLDWDKPLSQQAPEVQKALQSVVGDVTSGGFDLSRSPRNVRNAFDSSAISDAEKILTAKYGATKTPTGWVDKSGKPIQQDAVDKMLAKIGGKSYDNAGQLYSDLAHIAGSQADISAVLRNNGIPGIRYLDGGSRSAGTGTSNFVVFPGNEGLLTILERNGAPVGK